MKFKAAVLRELNKDLDICDISLQKPLSLGQILVKVETSGLCGAQLQEIRGEKNNAKFLPHLLGHEGYGTVVESTGAVFLPGDNVIMHWRPNTEYSEAPNYEYSDGIKAGRVTTFSEYAVVSENRLTKVKQCTTEKEKSIAALLGCSLTTACGIVLNEIDYSSNHNILILGGGGLGLSIAVFLRSSYMRYNMDTLDVVDTTTAQHKLELFAKLFTNVHKNVSTLTTPYTLIIDTVGNLDMINTVLSKRYPGIKPHLLMITKPNKDFSISPDILFNQEGLTISTTQGGRSTPHSYIEAYYSINRNFKVPVHEIITKYVTLEDINSGIQSLMSGNEGRVIISCS